MLLSGCSSVCCYLLALYGVPFVFVDKFFHRENLELENGTPLLILQKKIL